MAIGISDLFHALVKQGVSVKEDGIIVWTHCKYCNKSGWVSAGKNGCKLVHDSDCFIELATKWLNQFEEPKDLL
jgi:hypothetical protein